MNNVIDLSTQFNSKHLEREIDHLLRDIVDSLDNEWSYSNADTFYDYFRFEVNESDIINNFIENYQPPFIDDSLSGFSAEEILSFLKEQKKMSSSKIVNLLHSCSSIEESDFYIQNNELASASVGEWEYQVDISDYPELHDLVDKLPKDHHLAKECFWVYGQPCQRVILKLEPQTLIYAINQLQVDNLP